MTTDYPDVADWWKSHGSTPPAEGLLSNLGLIVDDLAASWLYISNSAIAFVGWPVSNGKATPQARIKALRLLLKKQKDMAKDLGFDLVFAYTNDPALLKLYHRLGFQVGDSNMTNMISGV